MALANGLDAPAVENVRDLVETALDNKDIAPLVSLRRALPSPQPRLLLCEHVRQVMVSQSSSSYK